MPDRVTFYAVVNDLSSRQNRRRTVPAYLHRRRVACRDEAFTRNLVWEYSSSLISAERGDLENEFIEITEDEARQLMEQLRARWTGAGGA